MTERPTEVADELSSNQEEADTELLSHANHALSAQPNTAVLIRSQAGDVDINILFLSLFRWTLAGSALIAIPESQE